MKFSDGKIEIVAKENFRKYKIKGDIDHHSSSRIKNLIDSEMFVERPDAVALDLSEVDFMDSSGLGLILGRYKTATELGIDFSVTDPAPSVMKIIKLAGCDRFINITGKKETK